MALSDDFILCDTTIWPTLSMPVMHPAFSFLSLACVLACLSPLDSYTAGVGNACVKTLQLIYFYQTTDQISANCMRVRIYNPAR